MDDSSSLVAINDHCERVSIFLEYNRFSKSAANWLRVAYGIKSIDYDGMLRDGSFTMCRPAYEYESEKRKLHDPIVTSLVRFNLIWSGLEYLITSLNFNKNPHQKGKINDTCYFLQQYIGSPISQYKPLLNLLNKHLKNGGYDNIITRFEKDWVTNKGRALYVIYELRNQFAHGDFMFPEPEDYGVKKSFENEIITISSRLILISIQMILLIKCSSNLDESFDYHPHIKFDNEKKGVYLSNLHLTDYSPEEAS